MIITTINIFGKKNGGIERVKNLISHFNIKEVTILTFFKYNTIQIDGIKYNFMGLTIEDIFNILYLLLFSNLPFSVCIFQRKRVALSRDITIFHLARSFQVANKELIFNKKNNIILDYCESHSHNLTKRLNQISKLSGFLLKLEIKKIDKFENLLLNKSNNIYFITNNDVKFIADKHFILPNKVILNNIFEPFEKRSINKLVFIGDMTYAPNISALKWLDVFLNNNDYEVHVIGKFIKKPKIHNTNKIIFYGYVDNIESIMNNSIGAVFFSKESTGLQNKILDYLNHGIPVFTNSEVADSFMTNHPFIIISNYSDLETNLNSIKYSKVNFDKKVKDGLIYLKKYYTK